MILGAAKGALGFLSGELVGSALDSTPYGRGARIAATKLSDFVTTTYLGMLRKEHEFMWNHGGRWLYSKFFNADLADQKLNKYWFGSQEQGSLSKTSGERYQHAINVELAANKGEDVAKALFQAPIVGDYLRGVSKDIGNAIQTTANQVVDNVANLASDAMQIG